MRNITGIYKIQSKIKPERTYIGSAVNIRRRWNEHLIMLRNNNHDNGRLQNHFNKYGESDLIFSLILGCKKEDLIKNEQFFIDSNNSFFNICKIAGSTMGFKMSKETLNRRKGKILTEETKQKIRESNIGKHGGKMSEETKLKLRESHLGKPMKEGTRIALIKANKGRRMTEAAKQKISKANKGNTNLKGKKLSEIARQHMIEGWVVRKQNKAA